MDESVTVAPAGVLGNVYTERLTPNGVSLDVVYVPGGTFWMVSRAEEAGREASEGPRHRVRVEPFWMGRLEVTGELVEVWLLESMQARGAKMPGAAALSAAARRAALSVPCERPYAEFYDVDRRGPAATLTAWGAQEFCRWLTLRTGRYHRLPTEAEWEYACRAGTETAYFFGDDPAKLAEYAWFGDEKQKTHRGGLKKPNPWGLYDLYGNVGEYVLDGWGEDYSKGGAGDVAVDPWRKHEDGRAAVVRGGDYESKASEARSAARRRMVQEREAGYGNRVFNHSSAGGVWVTGFRVVSPLRVEGDGRERCIPRPEF
jgi:formylglycine-generating enzyme required for sulfatase activity